MDPATPITPEAPVPYWPAYLPAAAATAPPVPYWPTPAAETALDTAAPDAGPGYEWYRELQAEAG